MDDLSPFGEPEPVEGRQVQLWSGGWSATKWSCSNTSPNGRRTFRRPNQILKEKIAEIRPFGGSPTIPSTSDLLNLTPLDFHLSSFSSPEKRLGLLVPFYRFTVISFHLLDRAILFTRCLSVNKPRFVAPETLFMSI